MTRLKVGQTGYAYVVDNHGKLIAYSDTNLVVKGEDLQKISEVGEFVKNPGQSANLTPGVALYTGLLGKTVVGTYSPLGTPEWAVVTEVPWREAYQSVIQNIIVSIVILLLMAVLAGLAGALVARRLASPLVDLSNAATEVAGGNLAVVAKAGGPAETVQLASTFNTMTSRLRELISSLEQRVKERTSALEEASRNADRRAAQFEAIALIVKAVNSVHQMDALLPQITSVISERFGYYHVGIFLNNEVEQTAVLAASNSEGGKNMLDTRPPIKDRRTRHCRQCGRNWKYTRGPQCRRGHGLL